MAKLRTTLRLKGVRYHSLHQNNRVWIDNHRLSFDKCFSIKKHCATGFDWGNRSPGAAQLALAICLEIYPRQVALEVYKAFKIQYLSTIRDDWFDLSLNLAEFNQIYVEPKLTLARKPAISLQTFPAKSRQVAKFR